MKYRFISLDQTQLDSTAKTVKASLSSEAPVTRFGEQEILSHEPTAIDLSRTANGLPLLFSHDQRMPIGLVEEVRLEKGRLVGVLRFGTSPKANEIWADVEAGILNNISIGYVIESVEEFRGGYKATRWTLLEASIVTVPADAGVGINRNQPLGNNMEAKETMHDQEMEAARTANNPIAIAERRRIQEIRSIVGRLKLDDALADEMILAGTSLQEARNRAIDAAAEHQERTQPRTFANHDSTYENPEFSVRSMAEALASRFTNKHVSEQARPFVGMRMVDMAKHILELEGKRTHWSDNASSIIERALHSSGDFSNLLLGAGSRILSQYYSSYQGGIKRIARQGTARDFRAKALLRLGEAPELLKVKEGGEIKRGSMAETVDSYSLATYARIFGITRQALVNDDLDAFAQMTERFGVAAAELEANQLIKLLTSNPVMNDGVVLFHANHKNLAAAGSTIDITSLGAARSAMRLQKGIDKTTPIDATPRYLIVPAALETVAEQYLALTNPQESIEVNPFGGKLELVVDPRLDAISDKAWYVASDSIGHLEYSHLEGEQGPQMIVREGFDVEGVEFKCRLDFGCGMLDWRGIYKNPGL